MAKRKRLELTTEPFSPALETKSALPHRSRMPIAEVAGEAAGRAAEAEMAHEMERAQAEGRLVQSLPIEKIEIHHLARDRIALDEDDMAELKASLSERGQQTPIEVLRTPRGYGLISGMRRVLALRALGATEVLALIRHPESAEAAYRAMVEENEIRSDLSFYERASIARAAVGQGVYPTPKRAVQGLFANLTSAKRSKILRFLVLREKIGNTLFFPTAIPEKLGLALAQAIEADARVATRIADALRKTPPADAAAERRVIERALKGQGSSVVPTRETLAPGLTFEHRAGRVTVSGRAVDEDLARALRDWMVSHAKRISPSH